MKLELAKLILELDNFSIDIIGCGVAFASSEDRRVKIHYRESNYKLRSIEYYNGSGEADRDVKNGPAKIYYDSNGEILAEEYWKNSYLHRPAESGPAVTVYGTVLKREEFWEDGIQVFAEPSYSRI